MNHLCFISCYSITILEGNHEDDEQVYANSLISQPKNFLL